MEQVVAAFGLGEPVKIAASLTIFFLGTIASWFIQRYFETMHMRQAIDLRGEWFSQWRPQNEGQRSVWCTEKVIITRRLGRYVLTSKDNNLGYQWVGTQKLEGRKHLVGTWKSIRPGAATHGIVSFTVTNQGTAMFGTFHGPNDRDAAEVGPWVMARSEQDLPAMRARLKLFGGARDPKPVQSAGAVT